jgi:hypothetical protein
VRFSLPTRSRPHMALLDRRGGSPVWSLLGEERTSGHSAQIDANDPKQTFSVDHSSSYAFVNSLK